MGSGGILLGSLGTESLRHPTARPSDYAFQQHILQSLKAKTGRCAVLWPHGVLFRQEETEIRTKLIEADLIECVLGLGPNLFYNSPMEACVVICNVAKPKARKGKILFINAVGEVTRQSAQSFLTEEHIAHIVSAYQDFKEEPGFCRAVPIEEIRSKNGNLSIPLYIESSKEGKDSKSDSTSDLGTSLTNCIESSTGLANSLADLIPEADSMRKTGEVQVNTEWASLPIFDRKGWKRVKFGDVVENCNETCDPDEAGLERFIAMEHLEPGSLHINSWGDVSEGTTFTRRCRPGQLLFGKRRAYQRKVAVAEFEAVVSGDIYVLAPKGAQLIPELLPFICLSERFFKHAVGTSAGSLSPRTNWSSLASFEFDLPPLDQQRRIAEILWAVDEAMESYRTAFQAARLAQECESKSMFIEHGPSRWPSLLMTEICTVQQGQVDPKVAPYSQMIHIAPDDIESETGHILEKKTAAEDKVISGKYEFSDKAVLYCKIRPYLRKVTLPRFMGVCSADMYPVYAKSNILPEFLFQLLLSEHFTKYAIMHSARSAFPKLNREALFGFQFRLPPLDVQTQFLSRLNRIADCANRLADQIEKLRHVHSALANSIYS